jgi:hypothetical protein
MSSLLAESVHWGGFKWFGHGDFTTLDLIAASTNALNGASPSSRATPASSRGLRRHGAMWTERIVTPVGELRHCERGRLMPKTSLRSRAEIPGRERRRAGGTPDGRVRFGTGASRRC